jgi:N-sulfoglucosamine sulfohydrolase
MIKTVPIILVALLLLAAGCTGQANTGQKQPNFLFILADDCSKTDLGCYGSKESNTPVIDQLAREGMKFERCYQAAPMCSPTRHNLYTGLYPVKTGAYPNHAYAKPGTKSVPHYLTPQGYRVGLSGKRHIAPAEEFPFEKVGKSGDIDENYPAIETFLKESVETNRPFALFVCSNEPHAPWNKGNPDQFDKEKVTLPPYFVDTEETRIAFCNYLAEVSYLDAQVKKVIDLLKKNNIYDNTVVVFASEQGNSFPFAKWTCYEIGVTSGLIIRYPGMIKAGSTSHAIVEYNDILPTFIEMAGGTVPEMLDGVSLLSLLKGKKKEVKEHAYSLQTTRGILQGSESYGIRSVVNKRYRYIWNLTPEAEFLNLINNSDREKYFLTWTEAAKTKEYAAALVNRYKTRPEEELYNVIEDPDCLNNLAENPETLKEKEKLRKKLLAWMEACGDKGAETEMEALKHQVKYLKNTKQEK